MNHGMAQLIGASIIVLVVLVIPLDTFVALFGGPKQALMAGATIGVLVIDYIDHYYWPKNPCGVCGKGKE